MTKQPSGQYVDLVINEARPGQAEGEFRFCTLSKNRGHKTINLRLPEDIQECIVNAYEQGKIVRIFG